MEFNNIIALVPEGEHFDASAVNDGVWLTHGHIAAIEEKLVSVEELQQATTSHAETLNANLAVAVDETAAALAEIAERDETIASLQVEIAALKEKPAGNMQNTSKENDEVPGAVKVSAITEEAMRLRAMRDGK